MNWCQFSGRRLLDRSSKSVPFIAILSMFAFNGRIVQAVEKLGQHRLETEYQQIKQAFDQGVTVSISADVPSTPSELALRFTLFVVFAFFTAFELYIVHRTFKEAHKMKRDLKRRKQLMDGSYSSPSYQDFTHFRYLSLLLSSSHNNELITEIRTMDDIRIQAEKRVWYTTNIIIIIIDFHQRINIHI